MSCAWSWRCVGTGPSLRPPPRDGRAGEFHQQGRRGHVHGAGEPLSCAAWALVARVRRVGTHFTAPVLRGCGVYFRPGSLPSVPSTRRLRRPRIRVCAPSGRGGSPATLRVPCLLRLFSFSDALACVHAVQAFSVCSRRSSRFESVAHQSATGSAGRARLLSSLSGLQVLIPSHRSAGPCRVLSPQDPSGHRLPLGGSTARRSAFPAHRGEAAHLPLSGSAGSYAASIARHGARPCSSIPAASPRIVRLLMAGHHRPCGEHRFPATGVAEPARERGRNCVGVSGGRLRGHPKPPHYIAH